MYNHISRRAFFIGAVRAGATGLAATSLSRTGVFGSFAVAQSQPQLQLNLPPYPFFDNLRAVMTENRDLLDRLVSAYARATPAASQNPIDFLSRYVPVYVFEQTLQPSEPGDPSLPTLLWLMHLAGYFGGVWLRDAFIRFPVPGSPNPRPGFPPTANSFNAIVTRINAVLTAFNGNDAGAIAYAEGSLRGAQLQGLTDSYGYNAGYLDQILTGSKPTNAMAPVGYFIYNPTLLFEGTYAVEEIRPLDNWRRHAEQAASRPGSRYAEIVNVVGGTDSLLAIQSAGVARGKATWQPQNVFLAIANYDQPMYDLLLVTSAYFLQCIQATGLAALAASAVGNADWARAAMRSNAMIVPYGGSYSVGLFDNTGQLPTFTMV
ncbi:MAG: hypothetical protein RM347_034440 [Nostoc sp. ChiQUE02]|uniref:hypothetical protein n=1 Tax=Nostoc sp. ChiQUE02 TaxID=3075377 RepID=UPI002AD3689D|nr:hypothetical protein [Nostoc sp. ChiQUE02]MDZ8232826.1 hypothetical protein [Nostoc sp. ChiQUE02]